MRLSLAAVALLVVVVPSRAEDPPKNAVHKLVADAVAGKQVAGAVYLVSKKGKVVLSGAVGQQDAETKMSPDSIFRIASMTKPITSAGVLVLVDDGKLKLTDPLAKYVPEFADPLVAVSTKVDGKLVWSTEKARRPITIHDLLTHTSGIHYRFLNHPYLGDRFVKAGVSDGVSDTDWTLEENVKRIAKVPLTCQPGEKWEYGLNTDVLGRVIEVASGKPLGEFLRDRLFAPLGMTDTGFVVPKDKRSRLAALYEPTADGGLKPVGDTPITRGLLVYSTTFSTSDKNKYHSGGGGLTSTAGDYHRFLRMLMQGGELDGKRVLKAETVRLMTTDQLGGLKLPWAALGDKFGYGFGVATGKGLALPQGSYSWGGLFYTSFWVDPANEVAAVLLTQLYPNDRAKLQGEFVKQVYKALGE